MSNLMKNEPLSNFDAFIMRMETHTNMTTITGLMIFDKPVEFERLRATLEHRLLEFDRFSQRIGEGGRVLKYPVWEFDPFFNLDSHLHRIGLPSPGDLDSPQIPDQRPDEHAAGYVPVAVADAPGGELRRGQRLDRAPAP